MPPESDVRALCETLAASSDYTTFLDVLPLQHMTQWLIHMPRPTLDAIVHLHDRPHLTLGAKDVLADVLRGYLSRREMECALARKPVRLGQHNKTGRIQINEHLLLVLLCERGHMWHTEVHAVGQSLGQVDVQHEPSQKVAEQRLRVVGMAPGVVQLRARLQARGSATGQGPARSKKVSAFHPTGAQRDVFCLTVVIES